MKTREQLENEKKELQAELERQKLEKEVYELKKKAGKLSIRDVVRDFLKTDSESS